MSGFTSKNTPESNNKRQREGKNKVSNMSINKGSKASGLDITQSTSTPSSLTEEIYCATMETQRFRIESLKDLLKSKYSIMERDVENIINNEDRRYKMVFISLDKEEWNTEIAAQMINLIHYNTKQSIETGNTVLDE